MNDDTTTLDPFNQSEAPQVIEHTAEQKANILLSCRTTRERLADALRETKMPVWMITNTELGLYDFDGRPKLLEALAKRGNIELIKRIGDGEFNHDQNDIYALIEKARRAGRSLQQRPQTTNRKQRRMAEAEYRRLSKRTLTRT